MEDKASSYRRPVKLAAAADFLMKVAYADLTSETFVHRDQIATHLNPQSALKSNNPEPRTLNPNPRSS